MQHFESAHARQFEVQDQQVERLHRQCGVGLDTDLDMVDRLARLAEWLGQAVREYAVIFGSENAHWRDSGQAAQTRASPRRLLPSCIIATGTCSPAQYARILPGTGRRGATCSGTSIRGRGVALVAASPGGRRSGRDAKRAIWTMDCRSS
ncbi:hypothetical protein DFQ28_003368 [Apophysomyces sp. BC1034]|nr:hypothetical protein DFQ28_003368 [Apophysomyces sp. BC1034]